jgi:hypothetical protein
MSRIRLVELPDRLVGKDADTVDSYHAASFVLVDVNGNVLIGPTPPTTAARLTVEYNGLSCLWLQGAAANNRYRSNMYVNSANGLGIDAYDDTGSVYLPITFSTTVPIFATDRIRILTAKTPANAGAAGVAGDICWDANFVYVCVAANTWKRAGLSTW